MAPGMQISQPPAGAWPLRILKLHSPLPPDPQRASRRWKAAQGEVDRDSPHGLSDSLGVLEAYGD
jgi:hypothetical protein